MRNKQEENKFISGIQQVGIGVSDLHQAWKWYRKHFSMDIRVFEDKAIADLMLPYTDGQACERHASLALNMQGGGGFEIWQHTGKIPEPHTFEIKLGDLGIFSAKIKTNRIRDVYERFGKNEKWTLGTLSLDPAGNEHFYILDPFNNVFEFVSERSVFMKNKSINGGILGVTIGITDFERSKKIYCDILGFNEMVYDREDIFEDFSALPGGKEKYRRILLKKSTSTIGPFSKFFGPAQIELIEARSRVSQKIYEGRIWGDLGFIHLCFDVINMTEFRNYCAFNQFPFTVDSEKSFDMGVASGHFAYIADPDGTLLEFVETHRLPIIKKLGLYLNLKKRSPERQLPDWMIKTLAWGRIKD